jgi:hypothetical protein
MLISMGELKRPYIHKMNLLHNAQCRDLLSTKSRSTVDQDVSE